MFQRVLIALVGAGVLSTSAHAALFTVNTSTDTLVRIDSIGNSQTVIGNLGFNAIDVDLAFHNGILYGINSEFGLNVRLFTVDITTGQATQGAFVRNPVTGTLSRGAESLASKGGQLCIGQDAMTNTVSNRWVSVDVLTGSTTEVSTTALDFDASASIGNSFYSIDAANNIYALYSGGAVPVNPIGNYSNPTLGYVQDIEFDNGQLFGLTTTGALHTISTADASLLNTVQLQAGTYGGLAYGAVPEPGSLSALLLLPLLRKRRQR